MVNPVACGGIQGGTMPHFMEEQATPPSGCVTGAAPDDDTSGTAATPSAESSTC